LACALHVLARGQCMRRFMVFVPIFLSCCWKCRLVFFSWYGAWWCSLGGFLSMVVSFFFLLSLSSPKSISQFSFYFDIWISVLILLIFVGPFIKVWFVFDLVLQLQFIIYYFFNLIFILLIFSFFSFTLLLKFISFQFLSSIKVYSALFFSIWSLFFWFFFC